MRTVKVNVNHQLNILSFLFFLFSSLGLNTTKFNSNKNIQRIQVKKKQFEIQCIL